MKWQEIQRKQNEMTASGLSNFHLTTVALEDNQHLVPRFHSSIVETYCEGYTNKRRDKKLDGYYFTTELHLKQGERDNFKNNDLVYIQCLPKY